MEVGRDGLVLISATLVAMLEMMERGVVPS